MNPQTALVPQKKFPGIAMSAFQHPEDLVATKALQSVPLFPKILKAFSGGVIETAYRMYQLGSCVRLGPEQGRGIYTKFVRAAEVLDIRELPDIYLSSEFTLNASAYGMQRYTITLNAPLVEALTEAELLAVIGHELGHVKCRHQLNKTLAHFFHLYGEQAISASLPVLGPLLSKGFEIALMRWFRMAELSCDRAALLVVQDPEVVASTLAKLAGWSEKLLGNMDLQCIVRQADDYDRADEKAMDAAIKLLFVSEGTHPFPAVRVKRILEWSRSEDYERILNGRYPREDTPPVEPRDMHCAGCGLPVSSGDQFCPACGTPQSAPAECKNCRASLKPGAKFCGKCGTATGA